MREEDTGGKGGEADGEGHGGRQIEQKVRELDEGGGYRRAGRRGRWGEGGNWMREEDTGGQGGGAGGERVGIG